MHSELLARSTIRFIRSLRRPIRHQLGGRSRLFTQNAQLLLIAPRACRPQLPYLTQPAYRQSRSQITRLLSTENKQYVKEQVWLATKWTAILWVAIGLGSISWAGIQLEIAEHRNPTPEEWRFWTRQGLRAARSFIEQAEQTGWVDWPVVGSELREVVRRLESLDLDGQGIRETTEGGIMIPDVGKGGYDISSKSWPWRAGYFEALMGCAKAAEHMDNMVLDRTRRIAFSKEYVVGPSNPNPRPTPSYMASAPLEENCDEKAFEKPETYYIRILTGNGFTTEQKLDAAFAYGSWLEFKKLNGAAEETYLWAIDMAKAGMREGAESVMDHNSYTINTNTAGIVTLNLLRATTNLAVHRARTGDVAAALPMFLSVLRARREAPVLHSTTARLSFDQTHTTTQSTGDIGVLALVKQIFRPPQFPPPPKSGDSIFYRQNARPAYQESELMLYIGEILFATSQDPSEGLGWTRQAVTIAEANSQWSETSGDPAPRLSPEEIEKCRECLLTGVNNWETMLQRLAEQAGSKVSRGDSQRSSSSTWRQLFRFGADTRDQNAAQHDLLGDELRQVERLKARIVREGWDQNMS